MIQYPLTLPASPGSRTIEIGSNKIAAIGASPYTGAQQVQEWPGEYWDADISMPIMDRSEAMPWIAALNALRGIVGTFWLGDPLGAVPRGQAGALNVVNASANGAHNAGATILNLDGLPAAVPGFLLAGDWLQIDTHLHQVLTDADTDANGQLVLDIFPSLRVALADNAAVKLANCQGLFRRVDNRQPWSIDENGLYTISFKAAEAL